MQAPWKESALKAKKFDNDDEDLEEEEKNLINNMPFEFQRPSSR